MVATAKPSAEVRANYRLIHETTMASREKGALSMWTIFDRPLDYPDGHIARCFLTGGGYTEPMATADAITGELETIRESMLLCGLYCLTRDPNDHPSVVETWL